MLGGLDPHTTHHFIMNPALGKFYYIDYTDHDQPTGSFFGIAQCVKEYNKKENGEPLVPPLYEFEHQNSEGKMCLSLFYPNEIVMEAR